jgi:uncharacterized protein YbjT (DUF2867 family)
MAAGKVPVIGHGNTSRRWIATDDVAALMAAVAVEPASPPLLTVGGPERMTKNDAIALAEQPTHRKIRVQRMPRPWKRPGTTRHCASEESRPDQPANSSESRPANWHEERCRW